jgi:hypothetical protein
MNKFYPSQLFKLILCLLLLNACFLTNAQVGTWTGLNNFTPYGSGGLMLLLTDGTVMAKSTYGGTYGTHWMKLTPDRTGSYINGTWTTLSSMVNDRLYFSTQVLKDGRVYVAGGEYGAGGALAEIYDPVTNSWTSISTTGVNIGDANSEILPDGRVLQALVSGNYNSSVIFDPKTNTYSTGPTSINDPDESAWLKLPDNSILMVDFVSQTSERYIPKLNKWIGDSNVPVSLYASYSAGGESGTAFMLPDGRAFFTGATGNTAYYTPSGNTTPGIWTTGPVIPNGQGQPDAPGAMMVNGKILLAVNLSPTVSTHFFTPTTFYEFDYLSNSFTQINAPNGTLSENHSAYTSNMLTLPDGSILYCSQNNFYYYVYKPAGAPVSVGKPTISKVTPNNCNGTSYSIMGTKFNGISEGACYGDDWQMASNYPIVRLTSGTGVYYARTTNWNSTGVQRGSNPDTAQFTLPAGLPNGTYSLVVTSNGFSSDPVSFTAVSCQPPVVSITSPINNSTFSVPGTVFVTATASNLFFIVSKVDFYNGSVYLGTSTSSPFTYNWTNVPLGTYTITAVATNNWGISTTSTGIKIKVAANQPPTISLSTPTNNSTFIAPAIVTITAIATDPDGTVAKVQFFNGTSLLGTNLASPYSFNWSNPAIGNYTISAVAFDNLGAATTATAIVFNVVANQPPTISLTSPANNSTFIAPAAVTIAAIAADLDGTIDKVQFFNGTSLLGTSLTNPYSFNWSNPVIGNYTISAVAFDNLGATTTSNMAQIQIVSPQLPSVTITSNFNNANLIAPATVIFSVTTTDNSGSVSEVQFFNGSTLIGQSFSNPFDFTWDNVTAGTYTITAVAIDNQYSTSNSATTTFTVSGTLVTEINTQSIHPIKLHPNPTQGQLTFDQKIEKVIVRDLFGIALIEINDIETIDISNVKSGIYIVEIHYGTRIQFNRVIRE